VVVAKSEQRQERDWLDQEEFNRLRRRICLVCRRWHRAAEQTPSLWWDLFAASASQWHLRPNQPQKPRAQIFGCGRMTLSQRASVPLATRSVPAPPLTLSQRAAQLDADRAMAPETADAPRPLNMEEFLRCWTTTHGLHLRQLSLAGCGAWVRDKHLHTVRAHCCTGVRIQHVVVWRAIGVD
jgi:hypothetical protein